MNHPEMHSASAESALRACETCGLHFTVKRDWSRFCSSRCRNAFHAAETRIEKVKARALRMYEALAEIAREDGTPYGRIAAEAIKDLKPPVEPKALLEGRKA